MTDQELVDFFNRTAARQRVNVVASDYSYVGHLVSVFFKIRGAPRCVVEDANGRLFIHNAKQVTPLEEV